MPGLASKPVCSSAVLALLVPAPTSLPASSNVRSASRKRESSRAIALPTTPAPTIATSYSPGRRAQRSASQPRQRVRRGAPAREIARAPAGRSSAARTRPPATSSRRPPRGDPAAPAPSRASAPSQRGRVGGRVALDGGLQQVGLRLHQPRRTREPAVDAQPPQRARRNPSRSPAPGRDLRQRSPRATASHQVPPLGGERRGRARRRERPAPRGRPQARQARHEQRRRVVAAAARRPPGASSSARIPRVADQADAVSQSTAAPALWTCPSRQ